MAAFLALGGLQVFKSQPDDAQPARSHKPREAFAADRAPEAAKDVPVDAERALRYLEQICKLGPRISGTDGMKKQQELVQKHFEERGAKVRLQRFRARQQSRPQSVEMANLIASWNPERLRRVILCSHYDTRPIADREEARPKWTEPFLSANDGGSGVALLMELAHHMRELSPEVGVDFVLFDGEEYVFEPKGDKYFFGSEHFAQGYRRDRPPYRYIAAVLLDMVAGKNAHFPAEQNSMLRAGALVQDLWAIAAELKCSAFQERIGQAVLDDHIALNDAGIPAVDIIDFNYPHWHRLTDLPCQCSADSLKQVARLLVVWLQRIK
jgi:hypothetical protein